MYAYWAIRVIIGRLETINFQNILIPVCVIGDPRYDTIYSSPNCIVFIDKIRKESEKLLEDKKEQPKYLAEGIPNIGKDEHIEIFKLVGVNKFISNMELQWLFYENHPIKKYEEEIRKMIFEPIASNFYRICGHKFSIIIDTFGILFGATDKSTDYINILGRFSSCFYLLGHDGIIILLCPYNVFNSIKEPEMNTMKEVCQLYNVEIIKYLPSENDKSLAMNGTGLYDNKFPNIFLQNDNQVQHLKTVRGEGINVELVNDFFDNHFMHFRIPNINYLSANEVSKANAEVAECKQKNNQELENLFDRMGFHGDINQYIIRVSQRNPQN
ncbi:MAG: hypothetical protein LBE13_09030 [Bacteroidales bacterium]|nr:hypothetical protein [Bacteroidales bacterium]